MYLYPAHLACTLHPAGHIDGVSPDVILGLAAPHHTSHHRTPGQANSEREHLIQQSHCKRWRENYIEISVRNDFEIILTCSAVREKCISLEKPFNA